jgi:anti-sigma B factor antagonist
MPPPGSFQYEFEVSDDSPEIPDSGGKITTVRCRGHLVYETRSQLEQMLRQAPPRGRIVIDLGDVNYVDSSGLGALIRLKLSAEKGDGRSVQFVNIAPSLMTLLRISNLESWFIA